jgi:hypothetical protein
MVIFERTRQDSNHCASLNRLDMPRSNSPEPLGGLPLLQIAAP